MIESLESRMLFSAVDTSGVGLFAPDGTPAALNARHSAWLVVHGLGSSKDDPTMQALATALKAGDPKSQVLIVNWHDLSLAPDNATAVTNAWATGDALAAQVRAAGLTGGRLNLLGFSMGGQVEEQLAKDLGGVNRLVAVDPAAPLTGVDANGKSVRVKTNFAADARYSIAFYAASSMPAALSANDTIEMTGLPGGMFDRHGESLQVVKTMLRRDAGFESAGGDSISGLFSVPRLLNGDVPAWRKNAIGPGFEGTLSCGASAEGSGEFEPLALTYLNGRGHARRVSARA